jgi:outer membrane lipopolysaccharide assembly protein LptE/RlpB
MNKLLNKIIVFFYIFFLISCAYEPVFKQGIYNFEIDKITMIGEKKINRTIENKLSLIKKGNDSDKRKYNILIESEKKRLIISNDSKGDPLKFEMVLTINFKLIDNGILVLDKNIIKKNIYNNESDKFELEQNEDIILENLSNKVSDLIISSIINFNDN